MSLNQKGSVCCPKFGLCECAKALIIANCLKCCKETRGIFPCKPSRGLFIPLKFWTALALEIPVAFHWQWMEPGQPD